MLEMHYRLWLRPTQRRQTSIQPQGKNATWNEHFHLPVDVAKRQKLVVVLYDHDTIGSDDELGRYGLADTGLEYYLIDLLCKFAWYVMLSTFKLGATLSQH